MSVIVIGSDHR